MDTSNKIIKTLNKTSGFKSLIIKSTKTGITYLGSFRIINESTDFYLTLNKENINDAKKSLFKYINDNNFKKSNINVCFIYISNDFDYDINNIKFSGAESSENEDSPSCC